MKIVAIGGGDNRKGQTDRIDEYIVTLAGCERPRMLHIPTASGDHRGYIGGIVRHFKKFGAPVRNLCLTTIEYTREEIEDKILSADIIYVGMGDTVRMLQKWREYGVDTLLRQAGEAGAVLCGLSAGCNCWFSVFHSDSEQFIRPDWQYRRETGLGFIPAVGCPHYGEERGGFDDMMRGEALPGIALTDGAALCAIDGKYTVMLNDAAAHAYRFAGGEKYELCDGEFEL